MTEEQHKIIVAVATETLTGKVPSHVVEELAQAVAVQMWKERLYNTDDIESIAACVAWEQMKEAVKMHKREQWVRRRLAQQYGGGVGKASAREELKDIMKSVLTDHERMLIRWWYWRKLTDVEVSKLTGSYRRAVNRMKHRLLERLREALEERGINRQTWKEFYYG